MKALLRAVALSVTLLASAAVLAGEAVPVNATFGIQWTPENWNPYGEDNPIVRETSSFGAAGLPNGKVIAIQSYDFLDTQAGTIKGEAALSLTTWRSSLNTRERRRSTHRRSRRPFPVP